jgi:hypothetical protein
MPGILSSLMKMAVWLSRMLFLQSEVQVVGDGASKRDLMV